MRVLRQSMPVVFSVLALLACEPPKNPALSDGGVGAFRGLLAVPQQLPFTCITPGCDSSLTVQINSNVNRRIAIKRIVLSQDDSEFAVTPSQQAPFILPAAGSFSIDVRLAVTRAPTSEALNLLITYTDASAEESADRVEAGEVRVPLVKRLVGEPLMVATPQVVSFGVVPVAQRKEIEVTVRNAGFGNIALEVDGIDGGTSEVEVNLPSAIALIPDAGAKVTLAWTPQREGYLKTQLELLSSTPGVDAVTLTVEGTSYGTGRIALEPEERAIDFGEVPKGQKSKVTLMVANVGGAPLQLSTLAALDPLRQVTAAVPGSSGGMTIPPLGRVPVDIEVSGLKPGPIDVPLRVVSTDPYRTQLEIPVQATVTEPKLQASPLALDWGSVPQGWVVQKTIELKNVGYGLLTLKRIAMVGGTSNLFTFKNLPPFPLRLAREERVAFDVEFRAQTVASFSGAVSLETDDAVNPFTEVSLKAAGGNCAGSCPIAHGTPSCDTGVCKVGSCSAGWHDTDSSASTGCECQDIGTDPGGFCSTGVSKGTLSDDGASSNQAGVIHSSDDEDWVRFFGQDASQFFGEDYDVRITLASSDPTIFMCVSRYDTVTLVNECYADSNQVCGIKTYRNDGSYGSEDGAMYYIKVYRAPGAAPSCAPYALYMSNG